MIFLSDNDWIIILNNLLKKYDDPLVYFTTALDNVYMENKPDIHHIL